MYSRIVCVAVLVLGLVGCGKTEKNAPAPGTTDAGRTEKDSGKEQLASQQKTPSPDADAAKAEQLAKDKAEEDASLEAVKKFKGDARRDDAVPGKPVTYVSLQSCPITDGDLKALKGFKKLKNLYLGSTGITDAGLNLKQAKILRPARSRGPRQHSSV